MSYLFKLDCLGNPCKVVEKAYYPCIEKVLYDLTFCNPLGINMFSHLRLCCLQFILGHRTRLLNAFARVKSINSKKRGSTIEEEDKSSEGEKLQTEKKKKKLELSR